MTRRVNKLFDLEIDEVSVVDRPANQHGLITFAKNDGLGGAASQEDTVPDEEIYDAQGTPVDPEVLEHGDVVYDSEGAEYVFVEDGAEAELDEATDEELDEVGKSLPGLRRAAFMQGMKSNAAAVGTHLKSNKKAYGIGAAATTGGLGTGYAAGSYNTKKSAGDSILEELSKAVNDTERDEIISKAIEEVEIYKAQAQRLEEQMAALADERVEEAFIAKAAEYNLPVSPAVLGPILKAVAEVLDDEQLDVLDQLFESVGDVLYEEVGYVGDTSNSSVLDQVEAFASELVGKADVTSAEAMVAAFQANPAAYDAYLIEQNGR